MKRVMLVLLLVVITLKKAITIALFTALLVVLGTPAHSITWCHDYSLWVISNTDPDETSPDELRTRLRNFGYEPKFTIPPNTSFSPQKLECGDVIIIGDAHSGVVNSQGGIDHYLQPVVKGKTTPTPYKPAQLPSLSNFLHNWTVKDFREYHHKAEQEYPIQIPVIDWNIVLWSTTTTVYPYKEDIIEVWHQTSTSKTGPLDKAIQSVKDCNFDIDSLVQPILTLSENNVEICRRKDLKNEANELIKKAERLQKELDGAKELRSNARGAMSNCSFDEVQAILKPFLTNEELKGCKAEIKAAQDLSNRAQKLKQAQENAGKKITEAGESLNKCSYSGVKDSMQSILSEEGLGLCGETAQAQALKTKAEEMEKNKTVADNALASSNKALDDATKSAQEAKSAKEKLLELKGKAENALSKGRSSLQGQTDPADKCAKAKELASELNSAVQNANSSGEEVAPHYQKTKDASKEACELVDDAALAEDKKEVESFRDRAYSLAREALDAKEKAKEKAGEAEKYAKSAEDAKSSIDRLLEEINTAKSNTAKAKEELSKGLVIDEANQIAISDAEGDTGTQNTVPSISGECFQDIITKAKEISANAEAKRQEALRFSEEARAAKAELDKIVQDIRNELAKLPGDEDSFKCDIGNLADEKDARAAAETADLFAQQSSDNWAEAEKCASMLRQAVLEFKEEEEGKEIDLVEDIPIDFETEVVDDPGYLGGECSGRITASPSSGYVGDPFTVTITIDAPLNEEIARVTTDNPGCHDCDAQEVASGKYTRTLYWQGTRGTFTIKFLAYDRNGKERCSGSTESLTVLGSRN